LDWQSEGMSLASDIWCSRRYRTKYGARMAAKAAGAKRKSDLRVLCAALFSTDGR